MGRTHGMVVRAAVHSARTTLSRSSVMPPRVSFFVRWLSIVETPCTTTEAIYAIYAIAEAERSGGYR